MAIHLWGGIETMPEVSIFKQNLSDLLGGKSAKGLEKSFGFVTAGDLLQHFPRRYAERGELTSFEKIEVGKPVTIMATVSSVTSRRMQNKRGWILVVTVTDGRDSMQLTFFNQKWREKELQIGRSGLFAGTVTDYRGTRTLTHPQYLLFADGSDSDLEALNQFAGSIIPVYPSSQSITSWQIASSVDVVLASTSDLVDPIPESVRKEFGLMDWTQALHAIHQPQSHSDLEAAKYRIKFHEAFVLQALLEERRRARRGIKAIARQPKNHGRRTQFDAMLPFVLTDGQIRVGEEIAADLNSESPMMRLLQGDVGSGKTIVALRAMLDVIESGGQCALLAPTEVLASQHFDSVMKLLKDLASDGSLMTSMNNSGADAVHVTLLTGSLPTAARKQALLDIACGTAGVVIGTHALIQDSVEFFDLGLVVIDEQHRFGVEQRAVLMNKGRGDTKPHVLVMTATPIPRTVALTTFGDLDVSTLDESPSMRAGVETHVVNAMTVPNHLERVWERMSEEVKAGNKVFIVCPSISEQENADDIDSDHAGAPIATNQKLHSVNETIEELSSRFPDISFGALHGQMKPELKQDVMSRFTEDAANPVDVLVATTVIEVGVDVPAATMMIIQNAERFGISQLHQLRGRIGRGDRPGLCILVQNNFGNDGSTDRLEAIRSTTNGFELAQRDLEIRREGDVLGQDQSGLSSSLRLLRVVEDSELIELARDQVTSIAESSTWDAVLAAIDATDFERVTHLEKT